MSDLADRLEKYMISSGMVAGGEVVLAAVSGGLDSMSMLVLLARLRERLNFELVAANFDHGLRGSQGDRERDLVESWCRRLSVSFSSGRTTKLAGLVRDGANLQAEARRLRYAFLHGEADRLGCSRIATGHHRDDQAETVLLRLTQGSSIIGLSGIQPVSGGRLIRPLLETTRVELEQFAAEEGIEWLEDPTNQTDSYRRNRLRHRLIPAVEREYDPEFRAKLAALAADAGELRELLDEKAAELTAAGVVTVSESRVTADCRLLREQSAVVRRHALRIALELATGGEVILSGRTLASVDKLAVEGTSGQRVHLPGGVIAWREFDKLLLGSGGQPDAGEPGDYVELNEGLNRLRVGGQWWELDLCVEKLGEGEWEKYLPGSGGQGAVALGQAFDLSELRLPLSAGEWYPGDRIEMFGGGSKKLKKLFTERRLPLAGRGSIPVLRDNDGRIVWVCGAARSSHAPLGSHTATVLVIEARRKNAGSENDSSSC